MKNFQEAVSKFSHKPHVSCIDGKDLKPVTNLMRLPVSKSMTFKCYELKIDTYNNKKGTRKMLSYKNSCLTNIRT